MNANADWDAAKRYLGEIQRATYEHYDLKPDAEEVAIALADETRMQSVYDRSAAFGTPGFSFLELKQLMATRVAQSMSARPTEFENPAWYLQLETLYSRLEQSAVELKLSIDSRPLLGTLPTGRVNGMAIGLPNNPTRIILFEQGLFGFANLMAKAVAAALPFGGQMPDGMLSFSTDLHDIEVHLDANPESAGRFLDAVGSYVVHGHPHAARPYLASGETAALSNHLRESMELFVLGHELGHVIAGHLDGPRTLRALAADLQTEEIQTSWAQEFEADTLGLALLLPSMMREGMDLNLSYWGAHLFFSCIEVIEQAVSLLSIGRASRMSSSTHPPTKDRQRMLQHGLSRIIGDEQLVAGPLKLASIVDHIVMLFWTRAEPVFRDMHVQGVRPGPWWTDNTAFED